MDNETADDSADPRLLLLPASIFGPGQDATGGQPRYLHFLGPMLLFRRNQGAAAGNPGRPAQNRR